MNSLPLVPAPDVRAQDPCAGLIAPRLAVGGSARVVATYGVSLKDRAATGAAGAHEVAHMPFHTVAAVLNGSQCNFGYRWWQVQLPDGKTGWAAEGNNTDYFLEPYTVRLYAYAFRAEETTGQDIVQYAVTPDGIARETGVFHVIPLPDLPPGTWQQVEFDRLRDLLNDARTNCPDRLAGTVLENVESMEDVDSLWLPPLDIDIYPAPDGSRLVLVRHQTLDIPRCDTVLLEPVGISRVSVLGLDGTETRLFPYPQHGSVPDSVDRYGAGEPTLLNVSLADVVWSPNGKYVAFNVAYRYPCNRQDCYRMHIYVSNLETDQLYVLGEGRHVGWTNGGEGINFFRLIQGEDGRTAAHLYTTRFDGANRQEIWLPGGAIYLSDTLQPLGLPWNDSGTRVLVMNAGEGEVMLFNLADRTFTPPVVVPDKMPQVNRDSVYLVQGEAAYLWTTIRGEFVLQDAQSGRWTPLESEVASTGASLTGVRPFGDGRYALVRLAGGLTYILDFVDDELVPVVFE
ncbi:MAG: hypothetical protein JXQ72_02040 [Anaerolineae bacterium]|nr:hypothetical protein [Anaerolineae bacterium]